jgi:threonine dehydrogenase-like Zn-dependent dehydrogenase
MSLGWPRSTMGVCWAGRGAQWKRYERPCFMGSTTSVWKGMEWPHPGVGEVVIRITLTTICGTDLHIVRGEYHQS